MATIMSDLALRLYAQTSELKKGLKEAGTSVKRFGSNAKSTGKNVSASFSNMSKGATSGLSQISSGLGGLGPAAQGATGGISALTAGVRTLYTALGPIGLILVAIGAAMAAVMAYFKGSEDGARDYAKVMGVLKAVMSAVTDVVIGLGRWLVKAFKDPQTAIKELWEVVKQNLYNRWQGLMEYFRGVFGVLTNGFKGIGYAIKGIFDDDAKQKSKELFSAMKDDMINVAKAAYKIGTGIDMDEASQKVGKFFDAVLDKSKKIAQTETDLLNLRYLNMKTLKRESELKSEIAELILKSRDYENATNKERIDAINTAIKKQKEINDLRKEAKEEEIRIQTVINKNSETSIDDKEKLNALEIEYNSILKTNDDQMRALVNRQNELGASMKKARELGIEGWEQMSKVELEGAIKVYLEKLKLDKQATDAEKKLTKDAIDSLSAYRLNKLKETRAGETAILKQMLSDGLILQEEYWGRMDDIANKYLDAASEKRKDENDSFVESTKQGLEGLAAGWKTYFNIGVEGAKKMGLSLKDLVFEAADHMQAIMSSLSNSLSTMFESAKNRELRAAGDNAAKRYMIEKKFAKKQQKLAITQALINGALGVTKAIAQLGAYGAIAAALIGIQTAAQVSLISSQSFAKGGLVYGPTLGLVGEGRGTTKNNPEVIAPLDKLQNLMGIGGKVIFEIQYDKLVGVLNNGQKVEMAY